MNDAVTSTFVQAAYVREIDILFLLHVLRVKKTKLVENLFTVR